MPIPTRVTMNFDSHITKVFMYGEGEQNTWTTSGTLFEQFAIGGGPYPVELTFESGYELDTVTVENATVSDKTSTGFSLSFSNNVDVVCTITSKRGGGSSMINIDLTTLSGYSTLTKGQTYSITVKAKASGYQDSDASAAVSYTVPQPTLAAPVITASDTTITWDAVENADSYDVYVDDTLYENVTGDTVYDITTTVTNGTYSGDTTITDTATVTITANSGYTLPDTVTVTGASQSWNKETGTLTLTNPTGAVTVSAACVAASYTLEAGTYKWVDGPDMYSAPSIDSMSINFIGCTMTADDVYGDDADYIFMSFEPETDDTYGDLFMTRFDEEASISFSERWTYNEQFVASNTDKLRTIIIETPQTVSAEFYEWAITGGNLVKQEGETWVLNETLTAESLNDGGAITISFTSNGVSFRSIERYYSPDDDLDFLKYTGVSHDDDAHPYANSTWFDSVYRTITFTQPVTDTALLTWLQTNGTKQ